MKSKSTFVPLNQLGQHVSDTNECLRRAQELYDREPTRAHEENLSEAKREHRLFLNSPQGKKSLQQQA